MSPVRDFMAFVASVVRSPGVIGAVAPSGPALSDRLASVVPTEGTPTVVELGPGTGVVSGALRRRLPPGSRHIAVELDEGMVTHLRRTRPWLEVIQGDASNLQKLLAESDVHRVDATVSGLPWTLFSEHLQRAIIEQVTLVQGADATFTTFVYRHVTRLPAQRRFRALLERTFAEVRVTPTVWRNVPPALTYQCRYPRST